MFSDNTFPSELGMLEIQQERQLESSDRQIADHLANVRFVERLHHFGIGDPPR